MAVENVVVSPRKVEAGLVQTDNVQAQVSLLEKAIQFVFLSKPNAKKSHPLLERLLDKSIPQSFMPDRSQYSGTIE